MRPGITAKIRVNPSTAMSVLDVLDVAGIPTQDRSFASCVSVALNILVETARTNGLIPTPDPYQFSERMKYHIGDAAPDRRHQPKKSLGELNTGIQAPLTPPRQVVSATRLAVGAATAQVPVTHSNVIQLDLNGMPTDPLELAEFRAAQRRLTELHQKKDLVDGGTEGVVWSESDQKEYDRLMNYVFNGVKG
jgi:hypothetical protein